MAYLNVNNMCNFEGRLVADPELSYIPTNGGSESFAKCKLKVAVDRNMTKEAKQKAQAANQPTADFVPIEIIGKKAEVISKNFVKGNGIRIVASYRSYTYTKDNQTIYAHAFDAVDFGFCLGGNGNNSNNNNQFANNAGGLEPQGFQAIDDDDLPF